MKGPGGALKQVLLPAYEAAKLNAGAEPAVFALTDRVPARTRRHHEKRRGAFFDVATE